MSVLAHPGPSSFAIPRRRHLTVVPAAVPGIPDAVAEPARLADVLTLPTARPVDPAPVTSRPAPAVVADAPLRLTARGRAVIAGLAILAAAVAGSVAGIVAAAGEASPAVEVVTVSSGDSLWGIAAEAAAPGADVRDVMSEIAELNGLEGTALVAGQQLTVPREG